MPNHEKMGTRITLTAEKAETLYKILAKIMKAKKKEECRNI